ncbi:MAG: hypothetical protein V4735_03910 [Pseudomonadota bacterium]
MSKPKLQTVIENAIQKADASYFFEDYTKQAQAVLKAIDAAGFAITAKDMGDDIWTQVAKEMRTGRLRPEEHVKDVHQTILRIAGIK